jgi:hypothetical protein
MRYKLFIYLRFAGCILVGVDIAVIKLDTK